MRQIGIGFQSYLADNGNKMPQRIYGDGTPYFTLLAPYTGNNTNDKPTSIFVCPTHSACSFPSEPSYGMNWYYDNISLPAVQGLSTTIMVAESFGPSGQGSNRADRDNGDPGELDSKRHNGTANYLFFDGHIERLKYEDTTNYWGTDYGNHNQQSP